MKASVRIEGHIGNPERDIVSSLDYADVPFFSATDMAVFLSANQNALEYEVTIKSGGGFVDEGFEIYDMLRATGKPITTIAEQADSIASIIFLAGDTRKVHSTAKPLIHFPFIENLFVEYATADAIEEVYKGVKDLQNKIVKVYAERTRANVDALHIIMDKNESISADMFFALGFATEVISSTVADVVNYRVCAKMADNNLTFDKMDKKQKQTWLKKVEAMLKNLGSDVKNLTTKLVDGATTLYFKTEAEAFAVGDEVYLDEAFTMPAPVGEHELETGEKIVLKVDDAGITTIESITPAADANAKKDEEMAAMKVENDRIKTELEAAQNEATALKSSVAELETKVNNFNVAKAKADENVKAVTKELEELRAMVLDADDKTPPPTPSKAQQDLEHRRKMRA